MTNGTTNTEILETLHQLDKKLGEHIVYCKQAFKVLSELEKDINGNGSEGMKFKNKTLWNEHLDKKDIQKEVKIALILSVLSNAGLLASVLFK